MARYELNLHLDEGFEVRQLIFDTKNELIDWLVDVLPYYNEHHCDVISANWRKL